MRLYQRNTGLCALLAAVIGALALTGCSQPAHSAGAAAPSGQQLSFVERLQRARSDATSDFERQVFDRAIKAGKIDPADYEEAVSRYLACDQAAGVNLKAVKQANGIYKWEPPSSDMSLKDYDKVTNKCADGTVMRIEALYKLQVANPNGLDVAHAAVECLQKYSVVTKSYTADDFTKDMKDNFASAPFKLTDDNAKMCLNSLGMAVG